jgi:uncharacterized protein
MLWLLTRGRIPFLAALALATAVFAARLPSLEVDPSNRSMNAERPAEAAIDREFHEAFGAAEEIVVAVATPRLLDREGLELLRRLTDELARLAAVRRVTSLANAPRVASGPDGATLAPLVPPALDGADLRARVEAALAEAPHLTGLLVSPDRHLATIVVEPEAVSGTELAELIAALRRIQARETTGDVALHVTGLSVAKHDVAQLVDRDQLVLVPVCLGVLSLLLALAFRRVSGVLLPLAVTGVSLVTTLGAYAWSGLALNPITSLLPPVIMVLSFMTSVHVYHGWRTAGPELADRVPRIRAVVRALAKPAFFAAFTTALGFASLVITETPAVAHFGAFAAIGVLVSWAVGMTLVPVALTWLPVPSADDPGDRPAVARVLASIARFSTKRPRAILAAAAALTVVTGFGIPRITRDTDLVRFLKADEPLVGDTEAIDRALGASSTVEIMIARRDGTPLARASDIRRVAAFMDEARREPGVASAFGLPPILAQLRRAETGEASLPATDDEVAVAYDLLAAGDERGLLRQIADPSFSRLRVRLAVRSIGSAEAANLVERIEGIGTETLGRDYRVLPTGAFVRFALDSNRLVASQVASFGFGYLTVFLAIGIMLRSVGLTLLAMIPNVIPLVWTGGLMGFSGIELSAGTAMIASAVIGLVVDDTIHYLVHFAREEDRLGTARAIHHTTTGIGAALATASLVLAIGFWVGVLGSFRPTIYFSALTGWTMLSGVICELFVLPACLMVRSRFRGEPA